jgi:hypothetical protein
LAQWRANRISLGLVVLGALAVTLGACSADLSLNNLTLAPKAESIPRKPDGTAQAWAKTNFDRAITAADLVRPDGQCAPGGPEFAATAPATTGTQEQPASPMLGGISLRMTECEVVRRAGQVDKVDLAANDRGERSVVLTYLRGPAPGIYRFTAGRLTSIERAPEVPAPAPEKPRKATNPKKPAGT